MKEKHKVTLAASILTSLLFLAGCSSSPHSPTEKFVLIAASTKVQYWRNAQAGLTHAAAEMAVKSEMNGPDGHDPAAEVAAFRHAVAEKPSGILVSVADAALLTPEIKTAIGQGIPVITIDSDAPDSQRLLFVGTDNYNAGVMGGKLAVKLLGSKGNVIVYRLPNQPNQDNRLSGYQSAFEAYPGIKVTQTINLQEQPDRAGFAYDNTKRLLDAKTKVDAFVCLESRACGGVADAVSRANLTGKVTIIAMDTDPEILDWVGKGVISATLAQKPYTMAYYGTKLLDDLFHHPPPSLTRDRAKMPNALLPNFVDTGSFVVDKSNVATILEQNKAAGQ